MTGLWGETAADRIATIEALREANDDVIARLYELLDDHTTIERQERVFTDPQDAYGQMEDVQVEVAGAARNALNRFATAAGDHVVRRFETLDPAAALAPANPIALGRMIRDGSPALRQAVVALGPKRVQASAETYDILVEMGAEEIVLAAHTIALPPERFIQELHSPNAIRRRFAHESIWRRSDSLGMFRAQGRAWATGDLALARYVRYAPHESGELARTLRGDPTLAVELDAWARSACAPLRAAALNALAWLASHDAPLARRDAFARAAAAASDDDLRALIDRFVQIPYKRDRAPLALIEPARLDALLAPARR